MRSLRINKLFILPLIFGKKPGSYDSQHTTDKQWVNNSKFPPTLGTTVYGNERKWTSAILKFTFKIFIKGLAVIKKRGSMVLILKKWSLTQRQDGSIFSQTTKTIQNKFKDVSKITIKKEVIFLFVDFHYFSVY